MPPSDHEAVSPGGLSVAAFARRVGLSAEYVRKLCKHGRVFGARKQHGNVWRIYPPAKLLRP